jgi:hypothetical protein
VACSECGQKRGHMSGCPYAGGGNVGGGRGQPARRKGACPMGGSHKIRYGRWYSRDGGFHHRLIDCEKCEKDLGTDVAAHNWKRATCTDCGRTRVERACTAQRCPHTKTSAGHCNVGSCGNCYRDCPRHAGGGTRGN